MSNDPRCQCEDYSFVPSHGMRSMKFCLYIACYGTAHAARIAGWHSQCHGDAFKLEAHTAYTP